MVADMVNAATLLSEPYTKEQVGALQAGGIYLFFTVKGPDAKQSYSFMVNPMQGFVRVTGDVLSDTAGNRAMRGVSSLDAAVMAIRDILESQAA